MKPLRWLLLIVLLASSAIAQTTQQSIDGGGRWQLDLPSDFDPAKPTQLILYALPNGNSIEWTIGRQRNVGDDWHFDIQHIGAQTKLLRTLRPEQNIAIAYLEADGKSWPSWRSKHEDYRPRTLAIVDAIKTELPAVPQTITLAAHSGGGCFITNVLDAVDKIPDEIDRIAFLDADYFYDDADHHGDKLAAWFKHNKQHELVVIAYDDRNVTFNGKKIVSETGGTYRATHRMLDYFA